MLGRVCVDGDAGQGWIRGEVSKGRRESSGVHHLRALCDDTHCCNVKSIDSLKLNHKRSNTRLLSLR